MFDIMSTGFSSPVNASLSFAYDLELTGIPINNPILGLGKADNGDVIATVANSSGANISFWVYRKNASGKFGLIQTVSPAAVPLACDPQPVAGGFIVTTPNKPNNRGAIEFFKRGADGQYNYAPIIYTDTASVNGGYGSYGGLAANSDWIFSAVNFDGSFLQAFKRTTGDAYTLRDSIMKPGTSLFASHCIRTIGEDTVLCSASNESSGATYSGAVYQYRIDNATNKLTQVARIVPPTPRNNGYYGNSITVMDKNNAIVVSRNGSINIFNHLRRPEGGAFAHISALEVNSGRVYAGNNAVSGGGRLLFCGTSGVVSNFGETMTISFNPTTGALEYLDKLKVNGTVVNQYLGSNQVVVGDQVIFASSFNGNATNGSKLSVFNFTTPQ